MTIIDSFEIDFLKPVDGHSISLQDCNAFGVCHSGWLCISLPYIEAESDVQLKKKKKVFGPDPKK